MKIVITIFLFTILAGCATTEPYRTKSESYCNYVKTGDCHDEAMTIANEGTTKEYRLSFLEYDDQGMPHFPQITKKILDSYRSIAANEDVLLLTFVHGWKHNASGGDGEKTTTDADDSSYEDNNPQSKEGEDSNIVEFREVLSIAAENTPGKKVIGVYVGWRGRSIDINGIDNITFWDRKNTAHEVGQQGITEALLELEGIVKGNESRQNRMVTIGHSFGGAALFSSLNLVMAERYISSRPYQSNHRAHGFGDLVVLLNPAFESLRYSSLFELSQDDCRKYPENQLPKLVVLSSKKDFPVSTTFKIGRFFNVIFEQHRDAYATHCFGERSGSCDKPLSPTGACQLQVNQLEADRTAVGHFKPYVTHDLYSADNISSFSKPNGDNDIKTSWKDSAKNGYVYFNRTALISRNVSRDFNPYMNIYTDGNVMSGHNDIWTDEVLDFLNEIIKLSAQ